MKKLLVASLLLSSIANASEFTVRVSDDAVSFFLAPESTEDRSALLGLIHNDDENSDVLLAGLFVNGTRDKVSGRLGGKVYYANLNKVDGYGMALGGEATLPVALDLTVNAGIYYGPSSLSFSDVDGYEEWFVKASYQVFENAKLSAGVGSLEFEPERGKDIEMDDGIFIEMNLNF